MLSYQPGSHHINVLEIHNSYFLDFFFFKESFLQLWVFLSSFQSFFFHSIWNIELF